MPPQPPRSPLALLRLTAIAALAIALAACGGSDTDPGTTPTSVLVATSSTATATTTAAADQTTTQSTASTTDEATTSAAVAGPGWTDNTYTLTEVARVDGPLALAVRPGTDDLWVAERAGRIRRLARSGDDPPTFEPDEDPALDISDRVGTGGEGGLLGLDFSPTDDNLVVSYTDRNGDSVLVEYAMDGDVVDPSSERVLLRVDQPFSNHNGGQVTFGPDGLIYFGLGDGGSGGDPQGNGQNTDTLLGAILRIDPNHPAGEAAYGIPADNPFADGEGGRPEIWLWGVRNPWRFSFDTANDDLWIGDVGQNAVEEIDHLPTGATPAGKGLNLGWRVFEGDQVYDPDATPPADAVGPIYTYLHENGRCSVTGGYVYRGQQIPALDGVYLFGDYCSGEVFGLQPVDAGVLVANLVTDQPAGNLISFGQDQAGELYLLAADGAIYRLDG